MKSKTYLIEKEGRDNLAEVGLLHRVIHRITILLLGLLSAHPLLQSRRRVLELFDFFLHVALLIRVVVFPGGG